DGCSNDGDPEVDCADPDCAAACGIDVPCSAEPENTPAACGDGCSNDGDVFIDCDDFDCSNIGSCPCASRMEIGAALCGDGCSNDGDALVDCADPDCATNPSCICVPDCAGRACGPNGCPAGDCGTCTAPAACDSSGSCVAACPSGTESSTTQCADGCDNDGDGRADCADSGCASIGSCPIGAVVVEDVTIAGLRAMRSDLVFGDLTVTGTLTIPARTETSVTITGANLDISRIDVEYLSCLGEDRDAPNVTLRASAQVRVGTVDLHGERGEDDGGMVCFDCWGGDGGNLTVDAPRIRVTGHIWLDGGGGATDQIDGGLRGPGCDGGDSGDLVLRSTTSLVCDGWGLSMDGGPGGGAEGSTWIGLDGDDGREGTLTLAGASIAIDEIEGGSGNASWIEAQPVPYAPLDILGHVDQTDDTDDRATGGIFVNITPAVRDFLEDLYELRVTTPGTLRVTLQFPSSDLDVYLLNSAHTMYLDSSNGVASPETFDFPVTAGTYYLGVSFSDDAAPVTATVPYTLQIR
ncbi:MAG: hypothetical protein K8H88_02740, partial [Sandaracinaceae bacterium]|nr:hypothetical protein [Sandaracinaceae bacterium]